MTTSGIDEVPQRLSDIVKTVEEIIVWIKAIPEDSGDLYQAQVELTLAQIRIENARRHLVIWRQSQP